MYYVEFRTDQDNWSVELEGSICQCINSARILLKTRYSGFNNITAHLIQNLEDQHYHIGLISKDGKWHRNTYKLYNAVEDSSTSALYMSNFKETPQSPIRVRTKDQYARSKYFAYYYGDPRQVRIARKLAKLKVAAAE